MCTAIGSSSKYVSRSGFDKQASQMLLHRAEIGTGEQLLTTKAGMARTLGPVALKLGDEPTAGTTQTLADHSLAIMDALFAPFDEAIFPRQLSVPQLTKLLESPLATRVPLPPSIFQSSPTELLYTPFWATVGYGLPELIGRQLGLNISESRDKEDASITIADKRRDYMQHLDNRLVVDAVSVFAFNLYQNARLEPLIPEFVMVDLAGRQHVVKLFINLVRWLRTVHVLSLLPPPPPARLLEPFKRPSPYPADEAGHQQSEVEITLRFKGVEKRFTVPGKHLQELVDVYGLLQHLQLSGAIRCASLEVDATAQASLW
ncbi:hypothetical protein WJX77_004656 [Trebouxia sp. C0004]